MTTQSVRLKQPKKGIFNKFLNVVEGVGNKMPHPVTLFILLAVAIIFISEIAARAGLSVDFYDAKYKTEKTVAAISLLNAEGLRYMITSATKTLQVLHH